MLTLQHLRSEIESSSQVSYLCKDKRQTIPPVYKSEARLFQAIILILIAYSGIRGITLLLNLNYSNQTYRDIFELTDRRILGGFWVLVAAGLIHSFVSVRTGLWRLTFTLAGVGLLHWGLMFFLVRGWTLFDGASTYVCFGAVLLSYTAFAHDPRVNQMLRKVKNFERGNTL